MSDPLKVLLVIHDFLPYHSGGSEIATHRLAKSLRARGVDARVVFTERHDDREQFTFSEGEYDGIPFHEVVYNHIFEDFEDMYDDPRMTRAFEAVLAEVRPDVVHFESTVFFGFGCVRAAAKLAPVVLTLHDYYLLCPRGGLLMKEDGTLCPDRTAEDCAACMEHYPLQPSKYGADPEHFERRATFVPAVERRMERVRELVPHVRLFTAPSHFLREMMILHGFPAERFVMTDNGYDPEGFRRSDRRPSKPIHIGYIGGLTPWKGVDVLLEACRGLPADGYRLSIYGDRTWFPDTISRLDALAEGTSAHFEGPYENARVAEILAGFDCIVVPSIWYENSPMTIHEAHLAGVPVIATGHGGLAEFVQDGINGLHFDRGSADSLRSVLRELIDDPGRLEALRSGMDTVKSAADEASEWEERYRMLRGEAAQ
ncbi:MAG: glycosyltransferase family 4 protein [Planctomycetota bacterium]